MSLDKLPDELIAHIGSFLNFEDNRQFGMSQKRIHKILNRAGLDKPDCHLMYLNDVDWFGFNVYLTPESIEREDVIEMRYSQVGPQDKFKTSVGKALDMFRSIDDLECKTYLVEENFEDFLKLKTKIREFVIQRTGIDCDNKEVFIKFCRKYKPTLDRIRFPPEYFCDEVFIQLLPHTQIKLLHTFDDEEPEVGDDLLTDRTLQALSGPQVPGHFMLDKVPTAFTIQAIKQLVKKLVEGNFNGIYYDLGYLKQDQKLYALQWLNETKNLASRGYRIFDDHINDENVHRFLIRFDKCEMYHPQCVEFTFKKY